MQSPVLAHKLKFQLSLVSTFFGHCDSIILNVLMSTKPARTSIYQNYRYQNYRYLSTAQVG